MSLSPNLPERSKQAIRQAAARDFGKHRYEMAGFWGIKCLDNRDETSAMKTIKWARVWFGLVFAAILLAAPAIGSSAAERACADCHDDVVFSSTAHPDIACQDCHTNVKPDHRRNGVEPLTDKDSCGECHASELRTVGRSVHGEGASCGDCHGKPHEIHKNSELASAVSPVNQIKNCGGCHNEPATLVDGYVTSQHGRALLVSGLIDAPSCSDCHGDHRILAIANERAPTSHQNSPEMCGACHLLLLDDWKNHSAHGLAWQEGEEGPVCTDCHQSHEIVDPKTAASRLSSADNCGGCHAEYLTSFRDSFHGKANELGFVSGATCADCHTPHKNLSADNPESSVHPANLIETCGNCHENVSASFASYDPAQRSLGSGRHIHRLL